MHAFQFQLYYFTVEIHVPSSNVLFTIENCMSNGALLLASERSERDTLRSVQLRIADILCIIVRANFVLITRKVGGA